MKEELKEEKKEQKERQKNYSSLSLCFELFFSFFKLGLFTIGGGMAMIPLIQGIVVDKKKWMTEEECIDCIAVSQGLPGVIAINMATYIGKFKKGFLGAVFATTGVILPSLIVIIIVVEFLHGFGDSSYVQGALVAIRASASALIAYSAFKVGKSTLKNGFQWVLAIITFVLIILFGINAALLIIAGIAAGIIYKSYKAGRREDDDIR